MVSSLTRHRSDLISFSFLFAKMTIKKKKQKEIKHKIFHVTQSCRHVYRSAAVHHPNKLQSHLHLSFNNTFNKNT